MSSEVEEFAKSVGATAPSPQDGHYHAFRSIFRRSNYFVLAGNFLVVKISRSKKPFWGVGKEYIDFLNGTDYWLVLLVSKTEGWAFSKNEVNANIMSNRWRLREKDNNYKINSPLPDRNWFYSPESFLKLTGLKRPPQRNR